MKDRDTQYRLIQNAAMACCFEDWIPGGSGCPEPSQPFSFYLNQLIENARTAGLWLEQQRPNHFGDVEKPFFLSEAQTAKVRGDAFELFCRAILWNCCTESKDAPFPVATITLGDNYDLGRLFTDEWRGILDEYVHRLHEQNISLSYSTPDLIGLNISALNQESKSKLGRPVRGFSGEEQKKLSHARDLIEGRMRPQDIIFACGVKTSLRSDRMYQLLFEANAWKYIWRHVFRVAPCPYYAIVGGVFGADQGKLMSVDFSVPSDDAETTSRAIDGVEQINYPNDVIAWFRRIALSFARTQVKS